jgi:choline-sulfatase
MKRTPPIGRRHVLKSLGVMSAASALGLPAVLRAGAVARRARPNLLVILADQHAARWSGFGGSPVVQTPVLDQLAQRGANFRNAYCASPLCVPSRMALLTGRPVQDIGIWDNNTFLAPGTRTFAHALAEAGYDVVLSGRMHLRGADPLHGFRMQLAADSGEVGPVPRWLEGGRAPGFGKAELQFGEGDGRPEDYIAETAAIRYLGESERSGKPWAMVVGLIAPHPPWQVQSEYRDRYRGVEIPLPNLPPGHVEFQHPVHRRKRDLWQKQEFSREMIRGARETYFALTTRIDAQVGRILQALEKSRQAQDTVVIYASDHGELLGEHALWNKSSLLEESSHVPLIMTWPGTIPGGQQIDRCVSLLDLTATLLALGGARDRLQVTGMDLTPLMFGSVVAGEDEVMCEHYGTWTDRPIAMLRRGRYKLHLSHREAPQLYDMEIDPGEFNDLARDPAHTSTLDDLTRRLAARWDASLLNERVLESQAQRQTAEAQRKSGDVKHGQVN